MEIRASLDTAILNLAANVAKSDGAWVGVQVQVQVCVVKKQRCNIFI